MAGYATGEVFFAAQSPGFRHSHLDTGGYFYDQKHAEPAFGRIPSATIWIFKDLGLLMFTAVVGLQAGILPPLQSAGISLVLSGMVVTIVPVIVRLLLGRFLVRIQPVLLVGGITGSMASGAALSTLLQGADSSVSALGYTGAYSFANIFLTIAEPLIIHYIVGRFAKRSCSI
ncbi:MAG TPA: hypothetical protein EYP57_09835 [Thermodesulfobacteriaceae bacterium]|nr:hypothetical protein [Thermodesulfobacteriaceae bacterium]